ncbi:MAG: hypothetical protein R3E68_09715 [Burkholderiaceae bacterium]
MQAEAEPDAIPKPWSITQIENETLVELAQVSADGKFSLICGTKGCSAFIQPQSTCQPGGHYPLLTNSARAVGIVNTVCVMLMGKHEPRVGLVLADESATLSGLFEGYDLTLAYPTTAGEMNVLSISPEGLHQSMIAAYRLIGISSASRSITGPEPSERIRRPADAGAADRQGRPRNRHDPSAIASTIAARSIR